MRYARTGLISMLTLVLVLVGCTKDWNPLRHTIIDWVDFVQLDGITYEGMHEVVLSDPDLVTAEVAGKVKFYVDEHVTNPNYKTKDGDAAFLKEGTALYVVQGLDPEEYLAVEDETKINGYKLYGKLDLAQLWGESFEKLIPAQVRKIEVYEGYDGNRLIKTLEGEEVLGLMKLLADGVQDEQYSPSVSEGDPDYTRLVFHHGGPILPLYAVMKDDHHYYWYPDRLALLSYEVGRYVLP